MNLLQIPYHDYKKVIRGDANWWWTKAINEAIKFSLDKNKCDDILLINVDVRFDKNYQGIYRGQGFQERQRWIVLCSLQHSHYLPC